MDDETSKVVLPRIAPKKWNGSDTAWRNERDRPRSFKFLSLLSLVLCSHWMWRDYHQRTYGTPTPPTPTTRVGEIKWWSTSDPRIDLGEIIVPLDYFNHSAGTTTLALGKYKISQGLDRKGSIFLNPGGPGGDGVRMATTRGPALTQTRTGNGYDLIGFAPRGIGKTVPKVDCFPSLLAQQLFYSGTVLELGLDIPPNTADPISRGTMLRQQREKLAMQAAQGQLCKQNVGADILKYMGTTLVARDIELMSRVIDGEAAPINVLTGSYGSILGAYLVNMFPDRIGRIVIDGIADPIQWSSLPASNWVRGWVSSADATYQVFLTECIAATSTGCALVTSPDDTITILEERIDRFLDDLYLNPLPVLDGSRIALLTSGAARSVIFNSLQAPRTWPAQALALSQAMQGNGTALLSSILPTYALSTPLAHGSDLARSAVACADSPPYSRTNKTLWPTAEQLLDEGLEVLDNVSRRWGMSVGLSEPDGGCQFWPSNKLEDAYRGTDVERFTGPWNHSLNNPILIISNTADPVTPIASGQLVHSLLSDSSALLVQNSPGHTSLSLGSLCTARHVLSYFADGTLPSEGTICEVDESPFGIKTESVLTDEEHKMLKGLATLDGIWQTTRGYL